MRLMLVTALAVVAVLIIVSFASAECAWVLWSDVDQVVVRLSAVEKFWNVIGSVPTREACERAQAATIKEMAKPEKPDPKRRVTKEVDHNVVTTRTEDLDTDGQWRPGGFTRHRFVCLPDTVDPRGPRR